ncbi:hypothetical protein [Streptomyces longwoodensis]|uniref:hypothetical protein n=1 Tax=Streptomyces longwoodensis TaxID=68231 RepID=UPI0036EC7C0D
MKPSAALRALCTAALAATLAACHTPLTQHAAADDKPTSSPARAALDSLPVHQAATHSGYDRIDKFGAAWLDTTSAPGARNACDTRIISMLRRVTDACAQVMQGVVNCAY